MTSPSTGNQGSTRPIIAIVIIVLGILGIVGISVTALVASHNKEETSRLIFASILPLLGTWVGAVLAFYFSRDNLQTASETTLNAVRAAGGLSTDTLAAAVMIGRNRIQPVEEVADDSAARALPIATLYAKMKASGKSRLPILTVQQNPLYVVHEPDIDKYAQGLGVSSSSLPGGDTVQKLVDDAAIGLELTSFVTVLPTSTLGEARAALARSPHGKDIFVTDDGLKSGKVVGWLTNSDLARIT